MKQIIREQNKEETIDRNPYFDQRVSLQIAGRGRRQFKFNEPGTSSLLAVYDVIMMSLCSRQICQVRSDHEN